MTPETPGLLGFNQVKLLRLLMFVDYMRGLLCCGNLFGEVLLEATDLISCAFVTCILMYFSSEGVLSPGVLN